MWHSTPGRPDRISLTSGALDIPNGNLLKQNRPYGVTNMVNSLDSSANGICQNPLFASSLLNIAAPVSWARVVSTFGIGCTSRRTFSFSGFMSTQICTAPEAFGTTTIAAHHGVGSVTRDITPRFFNSVCTFGLKARGMFLGVHKANGCASCFSWILYSCVNVPKPENINGYCERMFLSTDSMWDN